MHTFLIPPQLRCTHPLAVLLTTFFLVAAVPVRATTVAPGCGATTYYQDDTDGLGIVAMEAEASTSNDTSMVDGHIAWVNWLEYTSNDAGNGGYVRVNTTNQNDYTIPAQGARLDFDIDFVKTGVHYIYLRYRAASGDDNSVHLYMDGAVFDDTYQVPVSTDWAWDRSPESFTITTTGTHTLTIFHREDGLDLDRIVITTDPSYAITGFGPDPTEDGSNNTRGLNERVETHMDYRTGEGYAIVEAENYTYNMSGLLTFECEPWLAASHAQASGGTYMMVTDRGTVVPGALIWEAPLLDYEISSAATDYYYLWVRHWAYSNAGNSMFVSTNYRNATEISFGLVGGWTWQRITLGNVTAYNGTIILSIVMREDGFPVDKLIMTTDGAFNPSATGPVETVMEPARLVYQQGTTAEHLVQLPMEAPSRRLAGTGGYADREWSTIADPTAFGGSYAVVQDPSASNTLLNGGLSYQAPIEEFDINFNQTGTHYIYVRHQAPTGNDNSYTYLFDDVKIQEVHINTFSPGTWRFYDDLPTINVPSTGIHTLTVAMREDGTPIDHIVLSTSPAVSAATLPVELLAFQGTAHHRANLITWSTAREEGTAYFHLERSARGFDGWTPIGSMPAAGNSLDVREYQFQDNAPPDLAYYRLITVDQDGTESISSVITVARDAQRTNQLKVFPNPARDVANVALTLERESALTLRITSLNGQAVAFREVQAVVGENRFELPVDRLIPGVYTLTAEPAGRAPLISQLYVVR